jgi:hypothetical protein
MNRSFSANSGVSLFLSMWLALSAFCTIWCDEVCYQLLAKGALLIKDAQSLWPLAYSNFLSIISTTEEDMVSIIYTLPLFASLFGNIFL